MGSRRAAYVFARSGKGWSQQGDAILVLDQPYPSVTVAVDGQYAVVGVQGKTQAEPGTAYIFSDACATDAECGSTAFCAAGTCRARCVDDSECDNGRFCAADGLCREPVSAGLSCGNASDGGGCKQPGCPICSTGHCVDAVCCESACDGTCEACAAQLTGGTDGSCLPMAADQDLEDECPEGRDPPDSCLADCDQTTSHCLNGRCVENRSATGEGGSGEGGSGEGGSGEGGSGEGGSGEGGSGEGGGGVMAPEGEEAGQGGRVDAPAGDAELSATACGCRQIGVSAFGASDGMLPLLGLLLLGARRRRVGRAV
jgi:hypothetical protein